MDKKRLLVILVVAMHTLLLVCYTFPSRWVPERVRILGQFYARPLFHQQWLLFAPDPPPCSCELQVRTGSGAWASLVEDRGYLARRSAQALARHVQGEVHQGSNVPSRPLLRAMHLIAQQRFGAAAYRCTFRLLERCIVAPDRPTERMERITLLQER